MTANRRPSGCAESAQLYQRQLVARALHKGGERTAALNAADLTPGGNEPHVWIGNSRAHSITVAR